MDPAARLQVAQTLRAAAEALISAGYRIEEYESPLDYNRASGVRRYALVDPGAGDPRKGDIYFAEEWRTRTKNPRTGKPLKKPKTELAAPGAKPGVVAFVDWSPWGSGVYIHYMKTRNDARGKQMAQRLLDHLYTRHKNASFIDWGKVMNEAAWSLFKRYEALSEHGYPPSSGKVFF